MPRLERGRRTVRFRRLFTRATLLAAPLVAMLVVAGLAGARSAIVGDISQINCVDETGSGGCDNGMSLTGARSVALTGDGSRVIVASPGSDAIAIFARNSDGDLTQLVKGTTQAGCVSQGGGPGGQCLTGHGFLAPMDVATVGDTAYVASEGSNAVDVVIKDRDSRQFRQSNTAKGCFSETDGTCTAGRGLTGASSVAINPAGGGNFVYVGGDHTIAAFKRNLQSSELSQLPTNNGISTDACVNDDGSDGCFDGFVPGTVTELAFSNDGRYLYAALSGSPGALLIFSRAPQGPIHEIGCVTDDGSGAIGATPCVDGNALLDPEGVSLDRSGRNVYVTSNGSESLAAFSRDKITGLVTQLAGTAGCLNEGGTGGCGVGSPLANVHQVAVASNNKSMEVTTDAGVTTFLRDKKTGGLSQPGLPFQCISDGGAGGCQSGAGLDGSFGVLMTASKKHVYVASPSEDAIVALQRQ